MRAPFRHALQPARAAAHRMRRRAVARRDRGRRDRISRARGADPAGALSGMPSRGRRSPLSPSRLPGGAGPRRCDARPDAGSQHAAVVRGEHGHVPAAPGVPPRSDALRRRDYDALRMGRPRHAGGGSGERPPAARLPAPGAPRRDAHHRAGRGLPGHGRREGRAALLRARPAAGRRAPARRCDGGPRRPDPRAPHQRLRGRVTLGPGARPGRRQLRLPRRSGLDRPRAPASAQLDAGR